MSTRTPLVTQISIGRFHHFHLARQLQKSGLLLEIWTGYPRFKLRDETGIPREKIRTFPWLQTLYMAKNRFRIPIPEMLNREWRWLAHVSLDRHVSKHLVEGTDLIALSGSGLESGRKVKKSGGRYFCDRGSTHIRYQDKILHEEYQYWGIPFKGIDPRIIEREEMEYELADYVSVPSSFVLKSFVKMGFPRERLFLNPYGARLDRFRPVAEPKTGELIVLFVGAVSLRKGFLYLLQAFQRIRHPYKRLKVIGCVQKEIKPILRKYELKNVQFLGTVQNVDLPRHYSSAHCIVLPSLEEGLSMVMGEALACGCPVIATENTGARDLFADGKEGFIVSVRDVEALVERITLLMEDETLRREMSCAALKRVKTIGGWDAYGKRWVDFLRKS